VRRGPSLRLVERALVEPDEKARHLGQQRRPVVPAGEDLPELGNCCGSLILRALVLSMLAQGMSYQKVVNAGQPGIANRGAVCKARRRALDAIIAPRVQEYRR
jgi:hypothetical protein